MFGKKNVSILICMILILVAKNVLALTPSDFEADTCVEEIPMNHEAFLSKGIIMCLGLNYAFTIINIFILLLNKSKINEICFWNSFVLTTILAIGNYISSVILGIYSTVISYNEVNKISYYMPVFILIVQIAISINIIFKLRKGKNQPKCEKA